jgi:hypothetical protein
MIKIFILKRATNTGLPDGAEIVEQIIVLNLTKKKEMNIEPIGKENLEAQT